MRCAFNTLQYEIALEEANKVLASEKLTPQQTSEAKYIKAKSLFETNRLDDALTEFKSIAKNSKNVSGAEAMYHIAKIYFNKQDYKEAEKSINNLISFSYTNDDWNTKGMLLIVDCYLAKGELDDAEVILQTIIEGKPKEEYLPEIKKRQDELEEKKKARTAAQAIVQPEMKVEFNTSEGDKNLFTQPKSTATDSIKVNTPVEIPNQKPE